jgi:hypothetical protein
MLRLGLTDHHHRMPPPRWHTKKLGYSSNSDRRRMMRSGRIGVGDHSGNFGAERSREA